MRIFCCLLLMLPVLTVAAEQLPDPSKPFSFDTEPELIIQEQNAREENIIWRLNGIRIAEQTRSAILNGQVVNVGDTVKGARVVEIEPAWIIIEHEKQRIRLELLDINIKRNKQALAQNKDKDTEPK